MTPEQVQEIYDLLRLATLKLIEANPQVLREQSADAGAGAEEKSATTQPAPIKCEHNQTQILPPVLNGIFDKPIRFVQCRDCKFCWVDGVPDIAKPELASCSRGWWHDGPCNGRRQWSCNLRSLSR